jgi:hypothetical protein
VLSEAWLFLRTACKRPIVVAALEVALVVGAILNIINQGERVWQGLPPSWLHLTLNFLVPYCVSTYSAARNELRVMAEARQAIPGHRDEAASCRQSPL